MQYSKHESSSVSHFHLDISLEFMQASPKLFTDENENETMRNKRNAVYFQQIFIGSILLR